MTSQALERTWIHKGGYRWLRGEWVKVAEHSLWAVSGNSRDGETWLRKTNGIRKTISQNLLIKIKFCDIWQDFYIYHVLNENF